MSDPSSDLRLHDERGALLRVLKHFNVAVRGLSAQRVKLATLHGEAADFPAASCGECVCVSRLK